MCARMCALSNSYWPFSFYKLVIRRIVLTLLLAEIICFAQSFIDFLLSLVYNFAEIKFTDFRSVTEK